MRKFAKLFESKTLGQILVTIDHQGDLGFPEVRYHYSGASLGIGLDVCSTGVLFASTCQQAHDDAEAYFETVNEQMAEAVVKNFLQQLKEVNANWPNRPTIN